jgi:pimeloyl-ACP methyl ester carboxylesterase
MRAAPISLDQWRHEGDAFSHRSERVFFRRSIREGAPALLLIHGFPTASWDWNYVWQPLAQHFTLMAPDMMGYGFSAKPTSYTYSIRDQADICEELLIRSRVSEEHGYHILAHDVGDTVAQELLARMIDGSTKRPLRSICFLNGGLFPETHRPRFVQRLLLSPLGPSIARKMTKEKFGVSMKNIFGANTPPSKEDITAFWHLLNENDGIAVLPQLIEYMRERKRSRARWVGALMRAREAEVRVRLINGADDPVSGRHMVERYQALIPRPDVVLLNGIGHYPQVEAPREVLRAFLSLHQIEPLS